MSNDHQLDATLAEKAHEKLDMTIERGVISACSEVMEILGDLEARITEGLPFLSTRDRDECMVSVTRIQSLIMRHKKSRAIQMAVKQRRLHE